MPASLPQQILGFARQDRSATIVSDEEFIVFKLRIKIVLKIAFTAIDYRLHPVTGTACRGKSVHCRLYLTAAPPFGSVILTVEHGEEVETVDVDMAGKVDKLHEARILRQKMVSPHPNAEAVRPF